MRLISFFLLPFILTACGNEQNAYLKPRNLIEFGIPLTILAPDSVDINKENLGVQNEVTIASEGSGEYEVRIYFGEATTSDVGVIKAQQLEFLKGTDIFSKVTLDEPNGFIYETKIDSSLYSYGFRRILVQGNREYIFTSGSGIFTKAQAEEMYKATKPQEMRKQ
ncbi:MAG: hypothetical protein AAF573_18985 [Bacteroidota bacterium]